MTVEELLDQCRRDYLDDYTEMVSGSDDQLFRDSSLVRWFNEAERKICRETLGLVSIGADTAFTQITLATGVSDYAVDPRIIRILSARPSDTVYDLSRATYNNIRETQARYGSQDYFDVNSAQTATPGRPSWYATDVATNKIRFFPTPSSVENALVINLRAAHYPATKMSADSLSASPEIPEQYHHLLPLYAAAKALSSPNVDSELRSAARAFAQDFTAELRDVRRGVLLENMAYPGFKFGGWANDGS
jgi:hypothetical protein